ncbi:ankyrin repeat and death domain-containing protein 1A [Pundamilia nyererei]|uniref:Ankyrin repeat and death domain-containing protein 1A n=2 Tax=Haplochromini TaxID=319058 RepID=A0A9Y6JFL4_9CICH|nr:PREDICTED: ankyrin repeat and death domain-containing protein 1A [Pundamilia nyererei]
MGDELLSEDDFLLWSEKDFHDAAKRNDTWKMQELIKKGVDVNAKNKVGRKALHWAAGAGNEQALRLLLEHDMDINETDSMWIKTAAHTCSCYSLVRCIHSWNIVGLSLPVAVRASLANSPLLGANDYRSLAEFAYWQTHSIEDAISLALYRNLAHLEKNTIIPQHLDDLTPLHTAADGGHYECVRLLLDSGCNVNAQTNRKMNALHYVAQHGHDREASLLLKAGINVDAINNQHCTPLHLAVFNNHTKVVRLLIDAGSNLNATDIRQQTALHIASEHGWHDLAEMMLISRVSLSLTDKQGKTCLEVAARGNHVVLVDMIIKADRFSKWEKDHGGCEQVRRPLSFKQDHQPETQHFRSVLWTLATKHLCYGEWKILAQHWDFSEAHIQAIEQQWTGKKSFKDHGHRMLLIWLHGVLVAGENPTKGLYEGLVEISRTDLAEFIRQKANSQTSSPKMCCVM